VWRSTISSKWSATSIALLVSDAPRSKMIYVVASQQDLHLAQLFKIEELMGRKDISDKCQHINFGMVLGK
jgi:arginyl-tRNA synthetase